MKLDNLKDIILSNKGVHDKGITFIENNMKKNYISYHDIYNKALNRLGKLQYLGLSQGSELIFQLESESEFVITFWACMMGGITAIPLAVGRNSEHLNKLVHVFELTNKAWIITAQKTQEMLIQVLQKENNEQLDVLNEKFILTEQLVDLEAAMGEMATIHEEDRAFIQFSSGSTGIPKGVVLTHKNLMTNVRDIIEGSQLVKDDIVFEWVPLTHDLGMIGCHLTPFAVGMSHIIMNPNVFVHKPMEWIQLASDLKATILASPNFGYKHFLSNYKETKVDWDLSNIRLIFNGAEPINIDLVQEFLDCLKKYKLDERSMYTVYGMAEASLAIAFPIPHTKMKYLTLDRTKLNWGEKICEVDMSNPQAIKYSNNGYPLTHCSVKITDMAGNTLEEGYVGNIHIKGDNVTKEYYHLPEYTSQIIDQEGWLDTGDLGFKYEDCVYVTGRKKDLIIINGVNYYSHDLERVCEQIEGIRPNTVIVNAIMDTETKQEELVVFIKYIGSLEKFVPKIRQIKSYLTLKVGIEPKYILPVKILYKTTSGKIKRYKYVEAYYNGEFTAIQEELQELMLQHHKETMNKLQNKDEVLEQIIDILKEVSGIDDFQMTSNLAELGMTSLKIIQFQNKLEEVYPGCINISDIYACPTIESLYKSIIGHKKKVLRTNDMKLDYKVNKAPKSQIALEIEAKMLGELRKLSERLDIDIQQVFFSIFAYLFISESKVSQGNFQLVNKHTAQEVVVDLEQLENVEDLFTTVNEAIEQSSACSYSINQELVKSQLDGKIVVFNKYCESYNDEPIQCYDILMQAKVEEQCTLYFSFKESLDEAYGYSFVEKYNNILGQLI